MTIRKEMVLPSSESLFICLNISTKLINNVNIFKDRLSISDMGVSL
jgi:hypothetical protein